MVSPLENEPFSFATIKHPKCPLCEVPMWLVRIFRGEDGGEMHHFECKACDAEADVPLLQ